MRFVYRLYPLILIFLAGVFLWRSNTYSSLAVDTAIFQMPEGLPEFFPVVHGITNAYHMWRLDPVIGLGTQGFGIGGRAGAWLFVMGLGMGLMLRAMKVPKLTSIIFGILSPVLITLCIGFDVVVLGSLAWVPLIGAVLLVILESGANAEKLILLSVLSILLALSGNQLALPISLVLVGFTWVYSERVYLRDRYLTIAILLIPSAISAFFIPAPPFEKYPPFSHFVPGYGTKEGGFGLIGPEIQIPVVDLGTLREVMFWPGLLLTLFSVSLMILAKNRSSVVDWVRLKPWLFTLSFFALTIFLSSDIWSSLYTQMSPLAVIGRLMPGLSLVPIGPSVLGAGILVGIILLCVLYSGNVLNTIGTVFVVAVVVFIPKKPLIWDNSSLIAIASAEHRDVLVSPSLYLIRNIGLEILKTKGMHKDIKFTDLLPSEAILSASREGAELNNLVDKDSSTRARLAEAPQTGKEWLLIRFNKSRELRGVRLRNDNFFSDFPRGLEVQVSSDCKGGNPESGSYKTVASFPEWQGSIKFSRAGLPYFGPQGEVEVIFPKETNVQCLLVRQTYPEPIFDWSVTEIEVAG